MAWITTLNTTNPEGKRVEYQQNQRQGESVAESRARVRVSGRVVHLGWSSDGETFAAFKWHQNHRESEES